MDIYPFPCIGDYVHYVLPAGKQKGEVRPALIVRVWNKELVNLVVFVDGTNDFAGEVLSGSTTLWATSIQHNSTGVPGTWHHSYEQEKE